MSDEKPVLVKRDAEYVTTLVINSPDSRNALTTEVLTSLADSLGWAQADPATRVVVITGSSSVFASGADVRELRELSPMTYLASPRRKAWERILRFPKPLVAAVSGCALGGGCELALSADLIVASHDAVFGQPESALGLLPGSGGIQRWARIVGRFTSAEVVLLGRSVDAWQAQRLGLVSRVSPPRRTLTEARLAASQVAKLSPTVTKLGKQALRSSEELPLSAGLEKERYLMSLLLSTDDHIEGIDAFLEKRPPHFEGS